MSVEEDFADLLKIDFDLDVEKLFAMSLNFEHLKQSLTFLFDAFKKQHAAVKKLLQDHFQLKESMGDKPDLGPLETRVDTLQSNAQSTTNWLEKTSDECRSTTQQLQDQVVLSTQQGNTLRGNQERIEALEKAKEDQAKEIQILKGRDSERENQLQRLLARVEALEQAGPGERLVERVVEKREVIQQAPAPLPPSGADSEEVQNLRRAYQDLRQELGKKASQSDLQELAKQVDGLKQELAKLRQEFEKKFATKEELGALQKAHDARLTKLEEALAKLKQEMAQANWKELLERVGDLEDATRQLRKDVDVLQTELAMLKDAIRGLETQMDSLSETMDRMRANMGAQSANEGLPTAESGLLKGLKLKVDIHETKLGQIFKQLSDLESRRGSGVKMGGDSELKEQLEALKKELAKLKQDLMNMLLGLENQLNAKAEQQALTELEAMLLEKLESVIAGLTKKLADKGDTKKALKLLEKQIKNLYDIMQSKRNNEDDAMFSKKPLSQVSCASCEKDLVNLYGRQAQYQDWNRMPSRDPSDRIARVRMDLPQIGQGFSRLLSSIRVDYVQKTQHKVLSPSQTMPFYESTDDTSFNYSSKIATRPKTAGKPDWSPSP